MPPMSLRKIVGAIGLGIAVVVALSVPLVYAILIYSNAGTYLDDHVEGESSRLAKYIYANSAMWQYQKVRLGEVLETGEPSRPVLRHRIVTAEGRVVLDTGSPSAVPIVTRTVPIVVAGKWVAQLDVSISLRPFLSMFAFVVVVGLALGGAVFFVIRVLPLRALDRTLSDLGLSRAQVQEANVQLAIQNARLDAALSNMSQGLLMCDASGRIVIANKRLADLLGMPAMEIRPGMSAPELLHRCQELTRIEINDKERLRREYESLVQGGVAGTVVFSRTDGHIFSLSHRPMHGGGSVDTIDDITEQRRAEERVAHMMRHDMLTDLPNRVLFYERIEQFLAGIARRGSLAVLSLDLDHFRTVNDKFGHPVGDMLLQDVAKRIRGYVREDDVVARLGGDEFAIVQPVVRSPGDVTTFAGRLIAGVAAPYLIEGKEVVVGTSIGVALAPADGSAPDQLMKNADFALARAKADGGNGYRFFEPQLDARMQARRELELDLRKAVANFAFEIYYQPIVDFKTGRIVNNEALLRWKDPQRGDVSPGEFIPIAEEAGLIGQIGEWVLRQACLEAAGWPREVTLSVNISPVQFKTQDLVQTVVDALGAAGLPAGRLTLEITERVLLEGAEQNLHILQRLRDQGLKIALDDFGTGYSSLSYLSKFPFDKIKIDQSFVRNMGERRESLAIIRAVVGLSSSLGITTTAEGVETQAQLERLRAEGCTEIQGFLYSPARPAGELRKLLAELFPEGQAVA